MRISLNWLKKYVDIKISNEELVKLIGARLVEVEEVIDETKKYDNIFVVKVLECEPIEGTHLHLCKIDVGNEEVQVVCGAPNVHTGMLAAWIAPGAIVPQSIHEDAPFVIGKRKMLGKYDSFGMLAGADELDLGDDHSGIVEINPETAKPGDKLADIFELNDIILDIENKSLTHRPDCFGMIGFAREVAGILGQKFEEPGIFANAGSAEMELMSMANVMNPCNVSIKIADENICPFYSTVVLDFTRVETKKKYLTWQDTILAKSGMRPIDPIVDATNFVMLVTGQPTHAFDYDKFIALNDNKANIIVRLANNNEKLTLLDDSEVELNENDIVITNNNIPVALAGAMGGKNTAIDENTNRVILESATFSLYNLRKTQMAHGIFSEAITRFTKGQPASNALPVLRELAKIFGGKVLGFAASAKASDFAQPVIKISSQEINTLLGTYYSDDLIVNTLTNVGFKVEKGTEFKITAPAWRTDIHIKEDIIEEIGRLNGYDNIAPVLPAHATANKNAMYELKKDIRSIMSGLGANETLTYTFIHGDLMIKTGENPENSYKLVNSISPELQYLRQQIVPSLLVKSYDNLKDGYNKFALFEMNQVFRKDKGFDEDGVPIPGCNMALVVIDQNNSCNYYMAKKYLEALTNKLGIKILFKEFVAPKAKHEDFYEPKRSASVFVGDEQIGCIGEIKNSVAKKLKLPFGTAAFELGLEGVLKNKTIKNTISEISNFPSVSRDLTITTKNSYAKIYDEINAKLATTDWIYKIEPTSIYQPEGKDEKNISFHLELSDRNKTLESKEVLDFMTELEKIA